MHIRNFIQSLYLKPLLVLSLIKLLFCKEKFHKLLPKSIILYIIVTNPEDINIFSVAFILEMR